MAASIGLHSIALQLPMIAPEQTNNVTPEPKPSHDLSVVELTTESVNTRPVTAVAPTPIETPQPSEPQLEPAIPNQLTDTPALETSTETQTPETPPLGPDETDPVPYAHFPHPAAATAGCQSRDNCWSMPGNSRQVTRDLQTQLEAEGYRLEPQERETGIRVYAVSREGNVEYYLNVIEIAGETQYITTEQPMTVDQLNELRAS